MRFTPFEKAIFNEVTHTKLLPAGYCFSFRIPNKMKRKNIGKNTEIEVKIIKKHDEILEKEKNFFPQFCRLFVANQKQVFYFFFKIPWNE